MPDPEVVSRRSVLAGASAAALSAMPALARAPLKNTQAPAFHRFRIGEFEATVVSDGPLVLGAPSGDVFNGVSKEDMVAILNSHFLPTDSVELDQNTLVVNTGRHLVLFDTGTGPTLKALGPYAGKLMGNLKAAGIEPRQIDVIVLTHPHPDHCCGLVTAKGGRVFPNAQIYMAQADFDFFTDESKATNDMFKMLIGAARQNLLPNRDRIVFIKDGQEIVPGIQAMLTPGHTVGHTSYMITSQGQSLFNTGDVCHHPIISTERPRLPFAFDTDGAQGVASRLRVFDMLASSRTRMIAYHFPWPGVGFIGKERDAYRFFPAPTRTVI
ncbi:MAG: MBL fold metallo-hydrolase [Xanthobacteraceae bacterium]|nr:MBL fold metallo-hydrolase [Xanthobacteraceae bacterium]